MTEDFCRNIYNIGVELKCGLSTVNCLCPSKNTYEYLCYQCNLVQEDSLKEDYKLMFNPASGKVVIDHKFEREFNCPSEDLKEYEIINVIVEDARREINEISRWLSEHKNSTVKLVAMAMTQSWTFKTRKVSYFNLISAFATDQFVEYFWNMMAAIMRQMKEGKECKALWIELCCSLNDICVVYKERERIGDQYFHYLKRICRGMEKTKHRLKVEDSFLMKQRVWIDKKKNSSNLLEFIFCCSDTDGKVVEYDPQDKVVKDFIEICIVLKEFLMSYQEQKHIMDLDTYQKLISVLDMFTLGEKIDIVSIAKLKGLDLSSKMAWRANADIVFRYLRGIKQDNVIVAYTWSRA